MIRLKTQTLLLVCLGACVLGAPSVVAAPQAAPQEVHGRLEQIGPFRVLRVWGTRQQMGFAHGYFAGDDFLVYFEEMLAGDFLGGSPAYKHRFDTLQTAITVPPVALTEIEAVFEGIVAVHGKAPIVKGLGRALCVEDMIQHNAVDMLRAFGCSGVTVWGKRAGDDGVVTTRNFDFMIPGPKSLERIMILVREPTGKHKVASVIPPCYIGTFTGVNDEGVCAFMHDGTGRTHRGPRGQYTPVPLTLTDMLERSTPETAHSNIEHALRATAPYPFSYMIRVITPRVPGVIETPVRVFRIDAKGLSENPVGELACITTNHYVRPDGKPVRSAGEWSLSRYKTLKERVTSVLTPTAAWESLRAVAPTSRELGGTLHSIVVYPERRRLDLAFATWNGRVVGAPSRKPTTITFEQLFGSKD